MFDSKSDIGVLNIRNTNADLELHKDHLIGKLKAANGQYTTKHSGHLPVMASYVSVSVLHTGNTQSHVLVE